MYVYEEGLKGLLLGKQNFEAANSVRLTADSKLTANGSNG
jgi:hypothetical protein